MPPADIPFPVTSAPGKTVHESAGRLINCYAEDLVNGARSHTVWRRAPGTRSWFPNAAQSGWRGGILIGNLLYAAFSGGGGKVYSYTGAGSNGADETLLGTQNGTKKVFWARNNVSPPDVVFVDPDNGAFQVTTAPSVIAYPDADVGSPNSVCFLDGYFFFTYGDGLVQASGVNTTDINPIDFINVYGNTAVLRAVPFGELYILGDKTIEPYQNTANATGFPFTRVKVIPRGILGRYCVTGWEPGFGKGLFIVGDDRKVYQLSGYVPVQISTPDVDRAIADFVSGGNSVDDIEMFCYTERGHSCIAISSTSFTWVFDIDALRWHERQSYPDNRWRAYGTVNAFNRWLCGDYAEALHGNRIQEIRENRFNEAGGLPMAFDIYSGPTTGFPNRLRVSQATFDIARGVGIATGTDPDQTNPRCYISWSDDGGMNWSAPLERLLGRQQTSKAPVRINRAGQTKDQGRRWRITVYDDVPVELTGGKMSAELRNY